MSELNVEDLFFNEENSEQDYLEIPLSRQTFVLVAVAVILVAAGVLVRVGFLNVIRNDFYSIRAASNINREINLAAPRGIITDRFGEPLVSNKSAFTVYINAAQLLRSAGEFQEAVGAVSDVLDLKSEELTSRILSANLEQTSFIPVARNVPAVQAIQIKDLNIPSVQVGDDYVREYEDNFAFSHVLGYVGISDTANDVVGKSGIEAQYDNWLRGGDGRLLVYRDAAGNALDSKIAEGPIPGNDLALTIDKELQEYFYNRFRSSLSALNRTTGVAIAIDPRNSEILSLISFPSFDSNRIVDFLDSSNQPLFNRAISGIYTPGSAIKPLVALAALKENVVDIDKEFLSTGSMEIPNPYDSELPSVFLDWKPHGWVNLHSALAKSSNIYFYAISGGLPRNSEPIAGTVRGFEGLGINKLNEYWKKFMFGEKSGIDLPSEGSGFLPDPEEKEGRTGDIWRLGDTYNVSIGQGDLLVTPLQLINFISSIANGGKIHKPVLTHANDPQILFDYSDWSEEIREVQKGMEDAVNKHYGTASLLSYLPISTAGKTGSAQVANNTRTNAFFVGYAPAEDPEIAVLVLIENAKEGSLNAVPIAKDVIEWYYYNRILESAEN